MSIASVPNTRWSKNNLKDLLLRNTMVFILLIIFAAICYAMIILHDLTDTKIDHNDDEVD